MRLACFWLTVFALGGCSRSSAAPTAADDPPADENMLEPSRDPGELEAHARMLFDAVVHDDPALGEEFWFPKEPFVPLKDPPDPAAYWEKLHRAYAADIHALHGTRASWEGARFGSFEMGSPPKWIPPGEEHNRVGYYRSLGGVIHGTVGAEALAIPVDVIITWHGRWYVTHLRRVRK